MSCDCQQDRLPARIDLFVYQGATFGQVLTWKTGDPPVLVDLTGYSATLKVKDADGNLVTELSTSAGWISLGGAAGTITLTISAADTAALAPGNYVYDLLLTSGEVVTALAAGAFVVTEGVTA